MDPQALLDLVRTSPKDGGVLKFIVLRLPNDQRQSPPQATLSADRGVAGDRWSLKTNPNPLMQVSMMNSRFLEAIAGESERLTLAGDNLIVDLDLHEDNVPPGTRLRIGEVVLEVTDVPHTGCSKFERRYGKAVLDLTNTTEGSALHLRGVLARVIHGGEVRLGDTIHKEASHT